MKSREEVRFLTLLSKTQEKASKLGKQKPLGKNGDVISHDNDDEWRLPKFVETLDEWLQSLERHPQGPNKEVIVEYKAKVEFLKKVLDSRKAPQSETRLNKRNNDVVDVAGGVRRRSLRSTSPPSVSDIIRPLPVIPHGPSTTGEAITTEIHQKTVENHHDEMRKALLGEDNNKVRKRNVHPEEENDLDYLLKAHHQAQEQVAEEMLGLTKTLKEQTLAAKEIIHKDTAVIEKANEVADKNTERLKKETDRLQEHNKFSCRCWIWLLLGIVSITFIAMVWVMKLFRKRSDY